MSMPPDAELAALTTGILERIGNARAGLPQEVFLLVSQLTPLVNVDLLVRNDRGQTLLTWRADQFYGPGWHIPGGIVRFKETFAQRIEAVARTELGTPVRFDDKPLTIREIMAPHRDVRGHFISSLYRCELLEPPDPARQCVDGRPQAGQWQWHDSCPDNLIAAHEIYRPYLT